MFLEVEQQGELISRSSLEKLKAASHQALGEVILLTGLMFIQPGRRVNTRLPLVASDGKSKMMVVAFCFEKPLLCVQDDCGLIPPGTASAVRYFSDVALSPRGDVSLSTPQGRSKVRLSYRASRLELIWIQCLA